ncbi:TetR/AcrR family transcriptional regulator [Homoserinibacter sp. YIM 151385]|uniref:TetR/AcrR family transcriptional regulator n=1 Tax=Homoserinibacter sp. YIM 151385 TaxID=2985506 RepID=UPI0022EFF95E|nr:TetR/AcrR family transcriptional regulator [Homoserinibacter sp. YIM 151385]WBU37489.1 helix-turn-helix domain containing protein [Homoserinibacter sp. YIM 151385]
MTLRASTETRILDAAEALFFRQGIASTSIDAVLGLAGVSSATLYRGFASKEALLAAALERRQREWIAVWDAAIARAGSDVDRLLAVFDALDEFRAGEHGARWCAFLGSAAEYPEPPAGLAAAVEEDTRALRARLRGLARPLAGDGADALADDLLLLLTGSLAMRLREPGHDAAAARRLARGLVLGAERDGAPAGR